eukprot:3070120-Pleurochrysis_carterae.AAC.1
MNCLLWFLASEKSCCTSRMLAHTHASSVLSRADKPIRSPQRTDAQFGLFRVHPQTRFRNEARASSVSPESSSACSLLDLRVLQAKAATAAKAAAEAGAHESELDEVRDEVAELAALQAMRCQAIAQTAPATGGSARRSGASNDDEGPTPAATSTITKLQRKQCVRI